MCLERGLPQQSQTSAMVDVKGPDPDLRSHVYFFDHLRSQLRSDELITKIMQSTTKSLYYEHTNNNQYFEVLCIEYCIFFFRII